MIKIAFFDFDQTLYSHYSNSIPKSAIEAVNQLRNNGVKIFICSGRSLCEMDNFDLSEITIDGMIANNGQVAYDADNNILFDHPMDGLLKEKIVKKFKEKKVPLFVNTDVDVFANFINDAVIQTQKDINSPCPEVREYNGEKIYKDDITYYTEDFENAGLIQNNERPKWIGDKDKKIDLTLFREIWKAEPAGTDIATVTVHIKKIREKVEKDSSHPLYIETIWGVGYRFKIQ